jgi:hypothetical protein
MLYFFSIVLAVLWGWATPASVGAAGNTYYVSPGGSGSNPCSQSSPCSMNTGIAALRGNQGDTLILQGGNYNQGLTIPGGKGGSSEGTRTIIRVADGATVTIRGIDFASTGSNSYLTVTGEHGTLIADGQETDDVGAGNSNPADHIRLKRIEIKNFDDQGLLVGGLTNSEFLDLHVHHIGIRRDGTVYSTQFVRDGGRGYTHGIYFGSPATSNTDNVVDGGSWHDIEGAGIHAYCVRCTVRRITVFNTGSHGIWNIAGPEFHAYNNVSYKNGRIGGRFGIGIIIGDRNGAAYNNTVYGNPVAGLWVAPGADNGVYRNNIAYNNAPDIQNEGNGSTFSHNLCNNSSAACTDRGNPQFVNAAAGDFHLQAGSPAINAGVPVSGITTDMDQTPRPRGGRFDLGAYQYGGSPFTAPARPRQIKR